MACCRASLVISSDPSADLDLGALGLRDGLDERPSPPLDPRAQLAADRVVLLSHLDELRGDREQQLLLPQIAQVGDGAEFVEDGQVAFEDLVAGEEVPQQGRLAAASVPHQEPLAVVLLLQRPTQNALRAPDPGVVAFDPEDRVRLQHPAGMKLFQTAASVVARTSSGTVRSL
jgi:hypothetical protein